MAPTASENTDILYSYKKTVQACPIRCVTINSWNFNRIIPVSSSHHQTHKFREKINIWILWCNLLLVAQGNLNIAKTWHFLAPRNSNLFGYRLNRCVLLPCWAVRLVTSLHRAWHQATLGAFQPPQLEAEHHVARLRCSRIIASIADPPLFHAFFYCD